MKKDIEDIKSKVDEMKRILRIIFRDQKVDINHEVWYLYDEIIGYNHDLICWESMMNNGEELAVESALRNLRRRYERIKQGNYNY